MSEACEQNVKITSAENEEKLLNVLGLCARSRNLIFGVPQICEALGKDRQRELNKGNYPLLVFEASDVSDNTHKRISDKCVYYNVKRIVLAVSGDTLAKRLGKSSMIAAVAITHKEFCRLAEKYI